MGGLAITPDERARIADMLRSRGPGPLDREPSYRVISRSVGCSVTPVVQIAAELIAAGEMVKPRVGRLRRVRIDE